MSNNEKSERELLIEVFLFEVTQLIEQLEAFAISIDKENVLTKDVIDEVFRIMHTIKGSSAMMMYNSIAELTHKVEDLFALLRDGKMQCSNLSKVSDMLLASVDFIKEEITDIENGRDPVGNPEHILSLIKELTGGYGKGKKTDPKTPNEKIQTKETATKEVETKPQIGGNLKSYVVKLVFEEDCMMENIRAFAVIHGLKDFAQNVNSEPQQFDSDETELMIRENGLYIYFDTNESVQKLDKYFNGIIMVKGFELQDNDCDTADDIINVQAIEELINVQSDAVFEKTTEENDVKAVVNGSQTKQSLISVNTFKLDTLMDLIGEIVIMEAMLTKSPDLVGLKLENFNRLSMQLRKLTDEIKDVVMSLRMMSVSSTFQKMQRIVRDMNQKLGKRVNLILEGEDTQVDKSIIENISDPLMHIIRNAMDHGIESKANRLAAGKSEQGSIKISAFNAGSDVIISIEDDGKGINKDSILEKAQRLNLLKKAPSEMSEKDILNLLFLPGFSTKDVASEFSGRGVGLDVVKKNIEKISGSVYIDSKYGKGTTLTIKIPLTLAIIDGMGIRIGSSIFTIPIVSIKESFRPNVKEIIKDTDGNEMIIIRGVCYPVVRLHSLFGIEPRIDELDKGIILLVENDDRCLCLFADELIGEQQVVIKPLPKYIAKYINKNIGITGCTILGDGNLSLILNIPGLIDGML